MNDSNDVPQTVPIPPNIDTVNALFGTSLETEEDMVAWLDERRPKLDKPPSNGEEMSISRVQMSFHSFNDMPSFIYLKAWNTYQVGTDLYEKIFKQYTKKQWDKWPRYLSTQLYEIKASEMLVAPHPQNC